MKDAKQTVIKLLKNSYANGEITAQEHQVAYDKLKGADNGHDLLYYLNVIAKK